MRSWLVDRWLHLRASYWFIPSLMVIGAIAAAFGMVALDRYLGAEWVAQQGWLYINQPDGARALLSTLAGSMITVAGVTFSMTLLAVSHASAQIGPRLMTRFMRDRGNQFTLGTFIATFLYGLVVLRTVQSGTEGDNAIPVFVPQLAILLGLAMAVISVMVLIYFIHHVPQTISVARTISRVGDEIVDSVRSLFPQSIGSGAQASTATSTPALPAGFEDDGRVLAMTKDSGYLRLTDGNTLMELAREHDLVVEMLQRPGDYAIIGQPVMRVWPAERLDDDLEERLLGICSWGTERTREQDILFPVEQLLEILGKAMSPGVNGQYTAILCINQLARALTEALARDIPETHRVDADGDLRVIAEPITHEHLLDKIFAPVRQFTRGDWLTTEHLLQMLLRLSARPELQARRALVEAEIARLRMDIETCTIALSEKHRLLSLSGKRSAS